MIRYTIFVAAIVASAATAIASLPTGKLHTVTGKNVTDIAKNVEWTAAPLFVEKCAKEDCSDTPAS